MGTTPDVVVVGSGPNGLACAIRMAQAGRRVAVLEAANEPGGCVRSAELTLPGFVHDPFAAVFPLAQASPFFRQLNLEQAGMTWVQPRIPLAHPLDDGTAVVLDRSVSRTAEHLQSDRGAYLDLMGPLAAIGEPLVADLLAPPGAQRHPVALTRFGQHAIRSASGLASSYFHGDGARALLAGNAAHSFLPLNAPLTAGFALLLSLLGHGNGWPIVSGGARNLTRALVNTLTSLGGTVETNYMVRSMGDLPRARTYFFDTSPGHLARIAKTALPARFRRRLARHRHGAAAYKVDFALDGPVPWTAASCFEAGTIHVGGSLEEIAQGEWDVSQGRHPERPFVLLSQPGPFDPTRAPAGHQTLWAYCHVPPGSDFAMSERIEKQIDRFAPGFRDRILARHVMTPRDLQDANPNLVGGAINGGAQDWRAYLRWLSARPSPYATPNPAIFFCSAATPPGGGVHGMAGYNAAEDALRREDKRASAPPV